MSNLTLDGALRAAAAAPVLLVASDFDGTLSPLAATPDAAGLDRRAWAALVRLSGMAHTHAAVVSGRARESLISKLGADEPGAGVRVVGSHGLEMEEGVPGSVADAARVARLARLNALAREAAAGLPGAIVEEKPLSVALHYRMCEAGQAGPVVRGFVEGAEGLGREEGGVYVLGGHMVAEAFVAPPSKDSAVAALRRSVGASAVVFIGDDVTDEAVFAGAKRGDVSIKIGEERSAAPWRITGQKDVAGVLERLAELRGGWLGSRRVTGIERHSLLSDQRTAALVDPSGDVVWLCLPRIDSSPMFAALLGDGTHGEFRVRPAGEDEGAPVRQVYDGMSFVLRTEWGGLSVVDYFDCSGGRAYQRAGRSELVRVIEGRGRARVRFAPRLDFGRTATRLVAADGGLEIDNWQDPIVLRSPGVAWTILEEGIHQAAEAEIDLESSGGRVVLELRYGTASLRSAPIEEGARREQTGRFWAGWASTLRAPGVHAEAAVRGALVIKALCHGPTGAIAAAATTSLPEHLGGVRNWDYRYCWIRDACMSAAALTKMGNTGVALKLLDWLVQVVERTESPERLRPLYTVTGSVLQPEAEITEMPGYGESRPVRVGNAASHQVQLDVFGPVVDLVALAAEAGAPVTPEQWRLVESMVQAVQRRWEEPDHGIWEVRGPKRHHVHTKAMCWLAAERGLMVADAAMGVERPDWKHLRDRIARDVMERGWSEEMGSFTAAYGEKTLDAAVLQLGICGLVSPGDPRFVRTVEAVEAGLRRGPVVDRYRVDDGLPGREGAWVICATWLVEALALIGRKEEARSLLDEVVALAGPTGLMSEEFDPALGIALGNFPQAYSHLGVIQAAVRLAGA